MQPQTPVIVPSTARALPRRPVSQRANRKGARVRQTAHPDRTPACRKETARA